MLEQLTNLFSSWWFLLILMAWQAPWKGVALWKSARKKHLIWFIVFLFVNTLAILEILYIFIFSKCRKKQKTEKPVKKKK